MPSTPEIEAVVTLREKKQRDLARLKATMKGLARKIAETNAQIEALDEALRQMRAKP